MRLLATMAQEYDRPGVYGRLFGVYRWQMIVMLFSGDIDAAETYLQKARALHARSQTWPNVDRFRSAWGASVTEMNARMLEAVLGDFGARGRIVAVRPGPVVTLYEFEPAAGVKSSRVISLADDVARSMSAVAARYIFRPKRVTAPSGP